MNDQVETTERKKQGPKTGSRDKQRQLGANESLDRFDISNVRRGEDRVAMAATAVLGGVKIPEGMYGHWFQDKDSRLEQAMNGGYEVARDGSGKPIVRKKGMYSQYLMLLPLKLRQRDLDRKAQEVNNTLIEKNKLADGEYIPGKQDGSRAHVLERDRNADFDPLNQKTYPKKVRPAQSKGINGSNTETLFL